MRLNRLCLITLGSFVGFLSLSTSAEAILASVKTFGMAATGVAYPQDALAAAFNPAGHVEIGDRVDFGNTFSQYRGHSKIKGNIIPPFLIGGPVNGTYNGYKTNSINTPDFGINKRLGCECEWAIGLVAYNRNFSKTRYNKPFLLLGNKPAGLEYVHETISPVIAYKINDSHNIGISINCNIQRLKVNGIENFANPFRSVSPNNVTDKGYDYSTGWGVTFGWQWHITPTLTFGLTYQPETPMPKFHKYKGFLAQKGRFNIPTFYSAGIAWRFVECATIAFDVQRYEWKQIRALHNDLIHDGVLEKLGSKNGPGFGWKNQTFYRVGVDWAICESWIVRAGYRYGNSPIRRSQTVVNQLTLETVESFVTCGATYIINECNELSAFFAYGFQHGIKGKNSIPPGLPPRGFGGGEADLTQQQYAVGFSYGFEY